MTTVDTDPAEMPSDILAFAVLAMFSVFLFATYCCSRKPRARGGARPAWYEELPSERERDEDGEVERDAAADDLPHPPKRDAWRLYTKVVDRDPR